MIGSTKTASKTSKRAQIRLMLARPEGASLEALCDATAWQPHSVRAALSSLRKAGYIIERTPLPEDRAGASLYRIPASPDAAA